MKIILAGYNVDSDVLEELKNENPSLKSVTPETMSAAYARISRDPRSVDKLRAVARTEVERARRSNRNIIFKMGHHSVAEHAVFNFDIIGVSRLAIEEIEKFRLCSFTEKSQRYIKLEDDYIVPEEVQRTGHQGLFQETIRAQNVLYNTLYRKLKPYFFNAFKNLAQNPKKQSILNGWAKEDARYALSLATTGQLGMTANARNLEFLFRRFASNDLAEIQTLNRKLFALAKEVAPSLLLFTAANDFDARTYKDLEALARPLSRRASRAAKDCVSLVDHTSDGDSRLIAALLHTSSTLPYTGCLRQAKSMSDGQKREICRAAFRHMEFYDAVLREFEYLDVTFELVVSATCFAQLKRHRMATLTSQPYDPGLGFTVPPSIKAVGEEREFNDMMSLTESAYNILKQDLDAGAEYILTNSHRRRVLIKANARELYHISRLREDAAAQWDIREIVHQMTCLAKEVMPLTFLLIGAKDRYPEIYKSFFGRLPRVVPPKL